MTPIDRIAQAIVASMEEQCSFEHVGLIGAHVDWRRVAAAAVASLELHQEWQIRTDGAYFGRHLSREAAETELAERKSIEAVVPHPTDWDRNPEIVTRLVGPWRPTDSKEG